MYVNKNRMCLVFAKMNVNSHRAFVNVMDSNNIMGVSVKGGNIKKGKRYEGNSNKNVYQYVKRLKNGNTKYGSDLSNKEDIFNDIKENRNIGYHHRCKSIEDLVKKDTYERIKYKMHSNHNNNNNEINGCIPYN